MSFEDWTGDDAPPRDNGELVFAEPWHARAFAMAVALVEQLDLPWRDFQTRLIAAIAADPDREYYESWAAALESLVIDHHLSTADAITAATPTERAAL